MLKSQSEDGGLYGRSKEGVRYPRIDAVFGDLGAGRIV
jgi:hypothetical protein